MLKEVLASNAAKLIAACVCPVVGTAAVTMSVPKVRSAVHRMTAPSKPVRTARAKPRVRTPAAADALPASAGILCPDPVILTNNPVLTPFSNPLGTTAAIPQPNEAPQLPTRISFGGTNFIPAPGLFGGGGGGGGGGVITPPPEGVPEPTTWAQLIVGFGVIGGATRVAMRQRSRRNEANA
jgi:hypothetical protein